MRLALAASFLAVMALSGPVGAQPAQPASKVGRAAAPAAKSGGLGDPEADAMAAASRKKAADRERAWDLKMRTLMRGICTGC